MFERFTDRARKVMALANQEAQRFNHDYIGTEHILLGLVKEGSGVGAGVLKSLNVDLRKVRVEVEKLVRSGPAAEIMGRLPMTPRSKHVIEFAIEEARSLRHGYVGTEHLLLGLLREKEGVAAQVLINLGLEIGDVREMTLSLLGAGAAADDPEEPSPKVQPVPESRSVPPQAVVWLLERVVSGLGDAKDEAVKSAAYERAQELRDACEQARELLNRVRHVLGA